MEAVVRESGPNDADGSSHVDDLRAVGSGCMSTQVPDKRQFRNPGGVGFREGRLPRVARRRWKLRQATLG